MRHPKAFTLIELVVAMSIIVVLIGLATVGLRYAGSQSRANATRVAMENLKSMLAEMELATKFRTAPAVWYRYTPSDGKWHTCAQADFVAAVDFYHTIDVASQTLDRDVPYPARHTLAPARVTEDARANWTEMEYTAVANTAILMNALRTLPVNRAAMDRMPQDTLNNIGLAWKGAPERQPPLGSIQLVLDGWHNPIIFVPGTSAYTGATGTDPAKGLLLGRIYSNAASYDEGQYAITFAGGIPQSYRCIKAVSGIAPPNVTYWQPANPITAPNNRPFFASAGPDGDFSKGDDNIYSFEQ